MVRLDGETMLTINQWLRILPGKRMSGVAGWQGKTVFAKLFVAETGALRHWQRECDGSHILSSHDIPTPTLLAAGKIDGGGHYVLFDFLPDTQQLNPLIPEQLDSAFAMLGRMHAKGLIQEDAHFGNFLVKLQELYVIDGDAIRTGSGVEDQLNNLALLFAQLDIAVLRQHHDRLLEAYQQGNPTARVDQATLAATISAARGLRMTKYLGKCLRDCSQFAVSRTPARFVAHLRDETEFLAPLLAAPDEWIRKGIPLKSGRTATVALVEHADRKVVIKRYNIKGLGHALSRAWRPSRAWHSWREGHRLRFLGIPTPRPLALLEQRYGPWRGQAWLITEYNTGATLSDRLGSTPSEEDVARVRDLFAQLVEARISHGDLKAKNLLWDEQGPCLIDLDAMRQHKSSAGFRRAWSKDRSRFLRNWACDTPAYRELEAAIPII